MSLSIIHEFISTSGQYSFSCIAVYHLHLTRACLTVNVKLTLHLTVNVKLTSCSTTLSHQMPLQGGTSDLDMPNCKCQADLTSDCKCEADLM